VGIKLVIVTDLVFESFLPDRLPILGIRLIGHADTDPEREQREPGFVKGISKKRPSEIECYLRGAISGGSWTFSILKNAPVRVEPAPSDIRLLSSGVGASQPDEENVRRRKTHANMTEQDRILNRRVEIFLEPGATPMPQPTEPRAEIGMTLLEVLDFIRKSHPPKPFPPWMWDPKVPPPLDKDGWKKFKKMVKERLKNIDVDTVLSSLKDMFSPIHPKPRIGPTACAKWSTRLRSG
jgi:hypothetical protein